MNTLSARAIPAAPVLRSSIPQEVALDLDVANRWEALRAASAVIARSSGVNAAPVFRALWRRELAASTALGNGFAIPHARVAGISEPLTVYARLRTPVGFAAPDHRPTSELLVLLVPNNADNAMHLELLALIAEMFADSAFRARLVASSDAAAVRSTFQGWIAERTARAGVTTPG
jgi:PTS system nitrogen regulatory IIA component